MHTSRKLLLALVLFLTGSVTLADTVWIDVRTVEEYETDHINGDPNIPLAELDAAKLASLYPEGTEFMLYCRSGNRAGQAKELLEAAGFTNVTNAGSIGAVRELREQALSTASPAVARTGAAAAPPR